MDDALVLARAVHFAATAVAVGAVFFGAGIAAPAFAAAGGARSLAAEVRHGLAWLFWAGAGISVLSGAGWLILLAQQISGGSLTAVFLDRIVWIVLTRTDFGTVWIVRLVIGALLAAVVLANAERRPLLRSAAVALAGCFAGALAYAGHAGGGVGMQGLIHLVSDIVHLIASAAWAGGLLPLAILLHAAGRNSEPPSIAAARIAVQRFSTLGVTSVAAIIATGIINGYVLAGSVPALLDTGYGRLLLLKIALFLGMLSIAAVNRLQLTPRLVRQQELPAGLETLRRLRNNSLSEAGLAALVLAVVAMLGTLPPGLEAAP